MGQNQSLYSLVGISRDRELQTRSKYCRFWVFKLIFRKDDACKKIVLVPIYQVFDLMLAEGGDEKHQADMLRISAECAIYDRLGNSIVLKDSLM